MAGDSTIDWLGDAAVRHSDRPYLVGGDRTVSFGAFDDLTGRLAGGLSHQIDGRLVGLWALNRMTTVAAMFALWRAGASVLLLDARAGAERIRAQIHDIGVDAVFAADGAEIPDLGVAVVGTDAGQRTPPRRRRHIDDLAWVVHTSGSTGEPKPVRLTFGNLEAAASASAAVLDHRMSDRWLCALPISHVGGASILIRSAREGSTVVLHRSFDPATVADTFAEGTVTIASLVAATLSRTLDALGDRRAVGLRAVLVGGGPVPHGLVEQARSLGVPALPTYGMTETAAQVATVPIGDEGTEEMAAVPGAEIGVRDDGRIVVRGPMVSPGYLGEPSRDPTDWLVTGDLGRLTRTGRLTVLGRADDVIVSGGETVHPGPIEAQLRRLAGVVDVAVVGRPDPTWGSIVVAVYEGAASPGELERHARFHLAGSDIPRNWLRVDHLPRLPTGKPDRSAARRLAARDATQG